MQQRQIAAPGDLCNGALHNFALGPGRREGAHVLEVAGRESPHVRERLPEVVRKAVDGPGAAAFPLLAGKNRLADVPVEQHHRLVGGQHNAHAFRADALLDLTEQGGVVSGQLSPARRCGDGSVRAPAPHGLPFRTLAIPPLRRHSSIASKFRLMLAASRTDSALSSSSSKWISRIVCSKLKSSSSSSGATPT